MTERWIWCFEVMASYAFQGALSLAQNGQWDFEKQVVSGPLPMLPVKYVPYSPDYPG